MIKDISQESSKFKKLLKNSGVKEGTKKHHYSIQKHNKRSIPIYVHNNWCFVVLVVGAEEKSCYAIYFSCWKVGKCFVRNWINLSFGCCWCSLLFHRSTSWKSELNENLFALKITYSVDRKLKIDSFHFCTIWREVASWENFSEELKAGLKDWAKREGEAFNSTLCYRFEKF